MNNKVGTCPFTSVKENILWKTKIFKNFKEKITKTIENSENETFESILEKLAEFYLWELNNNLSEDYLEMMLNIENENELFTWFWNYCQMIFCDFAFENFEFSENQKQILEKKFWDRIKLNNQMFSWLIWQAFLDIFLLKILQKKFENFSNKEINRILQKNMFLGSMYRWTISEKVIAWIRDEKSLEEILYDLEKINEEIPGLIANCPFFHTKNQKNWVYSMMKFFDEKIIPKIPENSYFYNFK